MTAAVRFRRASGSPRRRWGVRFALAAATVSGSLIAGGGVAGADQTIFFDDAGNAAAHISLIGDSTLTGVRWYADYGALRQFNFVFSAESCRRTIEQSCISREGYRSGNVIAAMRALEGQLGEVLVVMSGYNDPVWTIDEAIEGVVEEARGQGVEHVVWLSLRTSDDVDYSDPQEQSSINTFREYNEQLFAAAAASDDFLQVADWATFSNGASSWFEGDGVHLSRRGVDAVTGFIAATVARVLAGENVSPAAAPWTVLVPGAEGELVESVQVALVAEGVDLPGGADGVYGNDTMAAVAEYQRRHDGLLATGAVDMATARSLGVYEDPDAVAESPSTTAAATTTTATTPATTPAATTTVATAGAVPNTTPNEAQASPAAAAPRSDRVGIAGWPLAAALALVVLAAAVAGRRRYVVARRAERRQARVHPATSPRRSVADMRLAGLLPESPTAARSGGIYDHEREESDVDATSTTAR